MTTAPAKLNLFLSYARRDDDLKRSLHDLLQLRFNIGRHLRIKFWHDRAIEEGTDWSTALDEALKACDSGLCLLSPAFFNSTIIVEKELVALLEKDKGIFPVLLRPLDFGRMHLGPVDGLQVFSLDGQAYSEMKGDAGKETFVNALFQRMTDTYLRRLKVST